MTEDEVARVVALAWGVAAAPQRGPKRELSHERIVESAMEIADAEGLQAVTMQRVAQGFGFTTMALYRYIASKDDLQQLMLDASVGDDPWPVDITDWRVGLEQWATIMRDVYLRHPWALDIPVSMEALLMPGQMRAVDAGMRAMRTLEGPPALKLAVLMTISVQVRGFAMMGRDVGSQPGISDATRRLVTEVATSGSMPDIEAIVTSGVYLGEGEDADGDDFGIALALLVPGIERAFEQLGEAHPQDEPAERTPAEALAAAETELAHATALRKATQRRVSELEREEAKARAARDGAKVVAKEAARQAARDAKG